MISNIVTISSKDIEVEPTGINKFLAFQRKLIIPLSHIEGMSMDYGVKDEVAAWSRSGTGYFSKKQYGIVDEGVVWNRLGVSFFGKTVGKFSKNGQEAFVNIKSKEAPLLILLEHEDYNQLILGVEEPQAIIDEIMVQKLKSK